MKIRSLSSMNIFSHAKLMYHVAKNKNNHAFYSDNMPFLGIRGHAVAFLIFKVLLKLISLHCVERSWEILSVC